MKLNKTQAHTQLITAAQAALEYLLANAPKVKNIRNSDQFRTLNHHANNICKPLRDAIDANINA